MTNINLIKRHLWCIACQKKEPVSQAFPYKDMALLQDFNVCSECFDEPEEYSLYDQQD